MVIQEKWFLILVVRKDQKPFLVFCVKIPLQFKGRLHQRRITLIGGLSIFYLLNLWLIK